VSDQIFEAGSAWRQLVLRRHGAFLVKRAGRLGGNAFAARHQQRRRQLQGESTIAKHCLGKQHDGPGNGKLGSARGES